MHEDKDLVKWFTIMKDQFDLKITIEPNEKVKFDVFDNNTGDKHILIHIDKKY